MQDGKERRGNVKQSTRKRMRAFGTKFWAIICSVSLASSMAMPNAAAFAAESQALQAGSTDLIASTTDTGKGVTSDQATDEGAEAPAESDDPDADLAQGEAALNAQTEPEGGSSLMAQDAYEPGDTEAATEYAGGSGTEEDPYLISTPHQLLLLAEQSKTSYMEDQHFKLTNDIDLYPVSHKVDGSTTNDLSWQPIATYDRGFCGTFDGNGHTIKNLYINTTASYQGLFARLYRGTIENLVVQGEVHGGQYVAGVVGYSQYAGGGNPAAVIRNVGNEVDV